MLKTQDTRIEKDTSFVLSMVFSKSNVSKPVFIDTNLGTHLAVPVSPDITVKELKRDLERMHLNCFPEFGSIRVNALMVKQRSRCYHLSESLPVKYAFLGSNGTWFLQMDAHTFSIPNPVQPFECNGTQVHNHKSRANVKNEYRLGHMQGDQFAARPEVNWSKNWDSDVITEAISETFSESVSISGIIEKYFCDHDEVASGSGFPFTPAGDRHKERMNSRYLNVQSEIVSRKKPEVGKRVLQASDNLGLSPSDRRPALSLCKSRKSPLHKSKGIVRNLVFEIAEESV